MLKSIWNRIRNRKRSAFSFTVTGKEAKLIQEQIGELLPHFQLHVNGDRYTYESIGKIPNHVGYRFLAFILQCQGITVEQYTKVFNQIVGDCKNFDEPLHVSMKIVDGKLVRA